MRASRDHPARAPTELRSRLLEGIRVIDLTNVLAGPFGAYQLALKGAGSTRWGVSATRKPAN
jgi:hypothetical protein